MIWSDKSVNLVYYWTCLTNRKRKEKKKKIWKGSCMEATKVISGVQGVFSDSVSKFKSPRMVNIIYTLGRLLIEDTLCLWV